MFNDDSYKKTLFKNWFYERSVWVKNQKRISETRNFYKVLYDISTDLERDSDSYEIIISCGYLKDNNNSEINHPVLSKRLRMELDSSNNTIYILNTDAKTELYSELFQAMNDINIDFLSSINTELMQNDYHPMDRIETTMFLKKIINKISSNGIFVENEEIEYKKSRFLMFYRPTLIFRKRLDGTAKAIEQILSNIEATNFVPKHLLDIVNGGVAEKVEEENKSVEEIIAEAGGESVDILLAKEANKEQLEIARRINKYNAVLVQGPPGTGKTHTIANLIGNFLTNGNSVLVTSSTQKALSVLKDKLPENMQSLCVSVIEDSNKDMERSISSIIEMMQNPSSKLLKQKEESKQERLKIIDELSKTRSNIFDILNSEYKSIILNGERISPSDAAFFVFENKDKLDYINGSVDLDSPLPLSMEELNFLYASNSSVNENEELELNYKLPDLKTLINPKLFRENLNKIEEFKININNIAEQKNWKIKLNNDVFFETEFGNFYVPDLNELNIKLLQEFVKNNNKVDIWCREIQAN